MAQEYQNYQYRYLFYFLNIHNKYLRKIPILKIPRLIEISYEIQKIMKMHLFFTQKSSQQFNKIFQYKLTKIVRCQQIFLDFPFTWIFLSLFSKIILNVENWKSYTTHFLPVKTLFWEWTFIFCVSNPFGKRFRRKKNTRKGKNAKRF